MRKSGVVLRLALVASVAWSGWLWSELRAERTRNANITAQLAQQSATRAAAESPEASRQSQAEASAAIPESPPPLSAPAAGDARRIHGTEQEWEAYQRQLMRDPKFREARREQNRLALAPRRANLIRLLGLTPEQADALIDIKLDQETRWQIEIPEDPNSEGYEQKYQAVIDAAEREYQDRVREILGEEKRARLQTYMESRGSRMQVDNFRAQLRETDALRDDQIEPLVAALHAERTQFQTDLEEYRKSLSWEGDTTVASRRLGEKQAQLLKTMNSRTHASAMNILSRTQLDTLDAIMQRELARFEAELRVQRIQSKLDLSSTPNSAN